MEEDLNMYTNIKQQYTIEGQIYNLILQKDEYALYENPNRNLFELLKLRTYPKDYTFPSGKTISKGDIKYPTTNDWGTHGWTFTAKQDALNKIEALTEGSLTESVK